MATNDTHPAVTTDSGPLPGPGLTLAPVSSLTRQPAGHLPAGERDRAQPCWIRRYGALTRLDHVAATPADTALRAPPISKTLQIANSGRLAVVSAARAAARRSSGSVATRGQLARIGTSE